ncbi:formylglycine-generating enzyme family protein [Sorangium sp. So ce1151]|uniref:formylglycine-generating enzyme family protein n=1 Tax=Sorangium sp. So ce1151 TaxID=3133332 RepID=UPI003F601214
MTVHPFRLHPLSDGLPDPWAAAWGEDRFGPFMGFTVGKALQWLRWIPPGKFRMGSPEGEVGRVYDEGPQHAVALRRGFWLADTPCTQGLWQAVMRENPSRFVSADRPVDRVSWIDCQLFFARLNASLPGLNARLPTEAEWEYACRGGTTGATWAGELDLRGDNDAPRLDTIAWHSGNSGHDFDLTNEHGWDSSGWRGEQYPHARTGPRPVRRKLPNPFGLFDMLGNVYEWCEDWYGRYDGVPATDPRGPDTGSKRVVRGGSWVSVARDVRAASRYRHPPATRMGNLGFRVALGHGPSPAVEPD